MLFVAYDSKEEIQELTQGKILKDNTNFISIFRGNHRGW
jgi:hypothetical protein